VPVKPRQAVTEYVSFPDWAVTTDFFLFALDSLCRRAFSRPQMRNRFAGRAIVECSIYGSPGWKKTLVLKEPAGSAERLCFALRSNIAASELPGLPQDVFLTLSDFSGERGIASGFFGDAREKERVRRQVQEVDRALHARMGGAVLHHAVEIDPDHPLPELRSALMPVDPESPASIRPLKQPVPIVVREGRGHRPLAVRLGRRSVEVARLVDVWKVDMWWLHRPVRRSYYELEQKDGRVLTVFRDTHTGCWFRQDY
jgi:hypothetical protein